MAPSRRRIELYWGSVSYLVWEPQDHALESGRLEAGSDDQERLPILLLHGAGLDSAWLSWGDLGERLAAQGYRVYAPDNPGHGESPPAPWTFTQARLVEFVAEVVEALGLDRYVIGGLSLGGGMTIGHVLETTGAADGRDRVTGGRDRVTGTRGRTVGQADPATGCIAGAMLFGPYGIMRHQVPGVLAAPVHLLSWVMVRSGVLDSVMRAYGRNRRLMETSLASLISDPAQRTPELIDAVMEAGDREDAFATFRQFHHDQIGPWRLATDYSEQLSSIPVPTLLVHGDRDTGVPIARAQEAAQQIPESRLLVVKGAGHWVQRDRPDVVTPAVLRFLSAVK